MTTPPIYIKDVPPGTLICYEWNGSFRAEFVIETSKDARSIQYFSAVNGPGSRLYRPGFRCLKDRPEGVLFYSFNECRFTVFMPPTEHPPHARENI